MINARIKDIAYYLPPNVLNNENIAIDNPNYDFEEINKKTGIYERRISGDSQTAIDMAEIAIERLLKNNNDLIKKIDFLIYCTQSPDYFLPSGACILQNRLKLSKNIGAFDVNLGCSGYIYGCAIAKSMIVSKLAKNVLLVTSDTYSKYINKSDRTCRIIFGDAASATIITETNKKTGIGNFILRTDGSGEKNLIVPAGCFRNPTSNETRKEFVDNNGCVRSKNNIFMDGQKIFAFSLINIPRILKEILELSHITVDDVDWFIYHQANKLILDELMVRSSIPEDKMVRRYADIGNTVSSSIPIAIKSYLDQEKIKKNQRLILIGFGVGYSWGACDVIL